MLCIKSWPAALIRFHLYVFTNIIYTINTYIYIYVDDPIVVQMMVPFEPSKSIQKMMLKAHLAREGPSDLSKPHIDIYT